MARNRINLMLALAAMSLGTAALLLPEPRPEQPPPAVDFEPHGIEMIKLKRLGAEETLQLEKRDGDWHITRPVERGVDGGLVARALMGLRTRTRSCYRAAEREPVEFGLDPPQARLQLNDMRVDFGYLAPDGRRYIRADGRLCLLEDVTLPILARRVLDRGAEG